MAALSTPNIFGSEKAVEQKIRVAIRNWNTDRKLSPVCVQTFYLLEKLNHCFFLSFIQQKKDPIVAAELLKRFFFLLPQALFYHIQSNLNQVIGHFHSPFQTLKFLLNLQKI